MIIANPLDFFIWAFFYLNFDQILLVTQSFGAI
jgi:hypothetical protein